MNPSNWFLSNFSFQLARISLYGHCDGLVALPDVEALACLSAKVRAVHLIHQTLWDAERWLLGMRFLPTRKDAVGGV